MNQVVEQDVTNDSLGKVEEQQPTKKEVSCSNHFHLNSLSLSRVPISTFAIIGLVCSKYALSHFAFFAQPRAKIRRRNCSNMVQYTTSVIWEEKEM